MFLFKEIANNIIDINQVDIMRSDEEREKAQKDQE